VGAAQFACETARRSRRLSQISGQQHFFYESGHLMPRSIPPGERLRRRGFPINPLASPMIKPSLLIVDDEKPTREGLRAALEDQYDVYLAEDAASAMALLEREHFAVMLTDFRLPQEDGMKLIARAKSLSRPPICILMTAYGSEELAVEAMKRGADDYISKGRLQIDELEMRIAKALRSQKLESENVALKQQLDEKFGVENIIGESPAMIEVFDRVRQVAPTRASVLILGESGTGKELIAKAIHQLSPRAKQPMVTVHCAGEPARERAVWSRERRVHGGARTAHWPGRAGAGRHVVSR
jgi:two-component system, NtrC family, response regulator AtoC